MFLPIGKPKQLSDIPRDAKQAASNRNQQPIAVIDDRPFTYASLLQSHGFVIRELGDINDLAAVESYSVIICDIKGVGKAFGSRYEGAHVAREIKKKYPDKYVIIFSSADFGAHYKRFFDHCDDVVKKDADSGAWVEALDIAIEVVSDPVKRWKRIRQILLEKDCPIMDTLLIEDAYVRSIQKKNPSILDKKLDKIRGSSTKRELLQEFSPAILHIARLFISALP